MNKRNYGIDLLKIVSMFMVVILHIQGNGGVFSSAIPLTLNDTVIWFIEILCVPAVNLFALTTGYLCIDKKYKYKNLISLWILVFFYNVSIGLLCNQFTLRSLISSMLPVLDAAYWYFSAYVGFMLFIPFINKFLNSLTKDEYTKLIYLVLLVGCIISYGSNIIGEDFLVISCGYSAIWLLFLYIIGGYVKLFNFKIKNFSKKICFSLYILFSLITLLSRTIILKYPIIIKNSRIFIEYNSIFIVASSFFLFLFFSKLKISDYFKKAIAFFSGLSFSVYLIHFHSSLKLIYLNGKFSFFAKMPVYQMVFMIFFTAFLIYVFCTVIDVFRYYLFKILRVDKFSEFVDNKIVSMLTKKG